MIKFIENATGAYKSVLRWYADRIEKAVVQFTPMTADQRAKAPAVAIAQEEQFIAWNESQKARAAVWNKRAV